MFRTIFVYFVVILYLVISLLFLPLLFILKGEKRKKFVYNRVREFAQTIFRASGSKANIIGKENIPEGPVLFVCNHQSYADIPLLLGYFEKPLGFIAKKELKKAPIISIWMRFIGCQFIDRSSPKAAVNTINIGAENLRNGDSLCIFPEGTRSPDGKIYDFKAGSFNLAIKAKVPIIPVSIKGNYKLMNKNSLKISPSKVNVYIDKPVYINDENKKSKPLSKKIHDIILDNFNKL